MDDKAWQVILVILGVVFTAIGGRIVVILDKLKESIDLANVNISILSGKFLVVVERGERHEVEIDKLKNNDENIKERLHDLGNHINGIKAHIEYCSVNKNK